MYQRKSTVHKSKLRTRRRKQKFLKFGFALFAFLFVLLVPAFLLRLDSLKMKSVRIIGNSVVAGEEVARLVIEKSDSDFFNLYPRKNAMLFPRKGIEKSILESFPRIKDVSLQFNGVRELEVRLEEKEPAYLWCPGTESIKSCLFMDDQGALIDNAPEFSSINYRLAPSYVFPSFVEDVKCAVRHIRSNAAYYNIKADKIGAYGHSAGAHLAAMIGTTDSSAGYEGNGGYPGISSRIQAVALYDGPYDLTRTSDFDSTAVTAVSNIFGGQAMQASPINYTTPDDPPFRIFHGDNDTQIDPIQAQLFHNALTSNGVQSEYTLIVNAGHSLDPSPAGSTMSPTRNEITQEVADFFDSILMTP